MELSDLIARKIDEQIRRKERNRHLTEIFKPRVARSGSDKGLVVHFDVGWVPSNHQLTVGVVIFSVHGKLVAAAALKLAPAESVRHAEAQACLEGLRLAYSLPSVPEGSVTIVGDAKNLIEGIEEMRRGRKKRDEGDCKEVMDEINGFRRDKESIWFSVCGREFNGVADWLATHVARGEGIFGKWVEWFPGWLQRRVKKDISFPLG